MNAGRTIPLLILDLMKKPSDLKKSLPGLNFTEPALSQFSGISFAQEACG